MFDLSRMPLWLENVLGYSLLAWPFVSLLFWPISPLIPAITWGIYIGVGGILACFIQVA